MKFIVPFFILTILSIQLHAFPDCENLISIKAFEKLNSDEKRKAVHPYLLQAFCQPDQQDKYLDLYFDTFSSEKEKNQRFVELQYLFYRVILKDQTVDFFDFFEKLLKRLQNRFPYIQKEMLFINIKFTYFNHRYGNKKACSFINKTDFLNFSDLPDNLYKYSYLLKLSKCSEYADDYNRSIFYLVQALKVAKKLNSPNNRLKSGHVYKALSKRYYNLEYYNNSKTYADSTINTFLPEFDSKVGLGVGYEFKALSIYQIEKDRVQAIILLKKAQNIYKKIDNISRYHYVERLKAKVYLNESPKLATRHLFNNINYFYKNKRKIHYTPSWLLAHKILQTHNLEYLEPSKNKMISYREVIDSLTKLITFEELQNQLKISSALIEYYSSFENKDSLIKYNQLQNELETKRNQLNLKNKQANVDLYLKNYKNEQNIASLNLQKQKSLYQNRLLSFFVCFILAGLVFYYFYKRKQKRVMQTKLLLRETQNEKLKTEQKLKEEHILRKEQEEEMLKLAYDNEVKRKKLLQLELEQKQSEVESAKLEKQSSLKLLNEVFDTLKNENIKDAGHLVKKLQANQIITKQNNSLKELFESISPHFMSKLNLINSNLTEQDVLYCVLIRQKYTTKQISNFLNISPKSVNQHKYRLKKKLAIPKDKNISTFIYKIK